MIDPDAVLAYDFGKPEQDYDARDAILYALGLGMGYDAQDLAYLDERALSILPSFAVTMCSPGMWIRDPRLGVDFTRLVHAAQLAEFPNPLPTSARVTGQARVVSMSDRGEGRSAVLVLERTIADSALGTCYCRLEQTLLLRGDGGFGGPPALRAETPANVTSETVTTTFKTSARAALIYRLSGDWNPLHLDPVIARAAGFERPILQGLASYGIAAIAVSRALKREPSDVAKLSCRFTGIVLPGDTLAFDIEDGPDGSAHFTARVGTREALGSGEISWRTP